MFDHHRKSPWFAEKYDPSAEMQNLRMRVRKEGWRGRLHTFLQDLESGKFDPDLTESEPAAEPRLPMKEAHANVGSGEDATAGTVSTDAKNDANGSATVESKTGGGGDSEMQMAIEVEEEAGDQETNLAEANGKPAPDARRGYGVSGIRGEEISVSPEGNQVMIRTIPPDIGRIKLEEVSILVFLRVPRFCEHCLEGLPINSGVCLSGTGRSCTEAQLLSGGLAQIP
jgi:hypothetical protein